MKSVTDRCIDLQEQLIRLRQVRQHHDKASELGLRREELELRRMKLASATAAATVLVSHQHLTSTRLPGADKAQRSCAAVRQRLDSDPATLKTGRDYSLLLSRLDDTTRSLAEEAKAAWSELTKEHEVDDRYLSQVAQVPGQTEAVDAIRLARAALKSASAEVPVSEEQYQHFLTCSAALQAALGKVDRGDFPDEVLAFFKKAQSPGGAPLSLLTDGVRAWLERKDMVQALRVRFGGEA